jgi:microcystin-dependent protein
MGQPFVGECRIFGGNFAPSGWMLCAGQLLPISENEILFNLIGTTYGGDGASTFGLPDLQGRVPIHQGTSLGVTFTVAEKAGVENVTLSVNQMPGHSHALLASGSNGSSAFVQNNVLASAPSTQAYVKNNPTIDTPLKSQSVSNAGGSLPHSNLQPYLTMSWIISLFGIFPSQT